MGEVYRARDPRIGRDVAIKTLPAHFGNHADALRRFEQEARAAGILNHPNVLAVYDVGSEGGAYYVVSELLEGESLAERIARGPIPRRKAIDYALQALRGLTAAHEKGIVHRDIKPANLFVTNDDRVKILDFGLAKLNEPAPANSDATRAMGPATSPGMILGSLGYMSPEQVRGAVADHRSDIFSIGVVLYEMLAGKQAFHGDSAVECMNAILKEDPPPLTDQPGLDAVIRHCLEKRPELRFQSARDLAFAIEAAAAPSASAVTSAITPAAAAPRRRSIPWIAIAGTLGALILAASAYWLGSRGKAPPPPEYHRLGLYHGEALMGIVRHRFAPDGQTIVIGGHHGVTFTRADSPAVRSLNLHDYQLLSVASNGDLALLSGSNVLATVPFSGGAPRALADNVTDADWGPDGKNLAAIRRAGGVNVIEYPLGQVIYRTANSIGSVRVSPKDDGLAFFEYDADMRSLVLLRKGERKVLSPGWIYASRLAWTPDGREIWFSAARGGNDYPIWAVDLDGRTRMIERVPGRLYVEDIFKDGRTLVEHDFSRAGIAYRGPGDASDRDLSWLDLTAVTAISNDGGRIVFSEAGEAAGGKRLVYLRDTSGGDAVRLGEGRPLSLSADGKSVLALADQEGKLVVLPTGVGQTQIVAGPGKLHESGVILNDGRILCWAQQPGGGSRLYMQEGAGWKAISQEFGDPRAGFQTVLSPSGDLVAARHGNDLLIVSMASGSVRAASGWSGADIAGWTADGKALYAAKGQGSEFEVERWDVTTGRSTPWKKIGAAGGTPVWIRITPDGMYYAYTYVAAASDAFVVTGLR
jgi:Tol biopolymer transport system component